MSSPSWLIITEFRPRPWLCIDAPAERLLHARPRRLALAVDLGELVLLHLRRALTMCVVELLLGARGERPHRRGPVARVLAHRGQERDEVGAQVAEHREEQQPGDGDDEQRRVHVAEAEAVWFGIAEEQERGDVHEQHVPLQRDRQRERRDDEQRGSRSSARRRSTVTVWLCENSRTERGARTRPTCRRRAPARRRARTAAGRVRDPLGPALSHNHTLTPSRAARVPPTRRPRSSATSAPPTARAAARSR